MSIAWIISQSSEGFFTKEVIGKMIIKPVQDLGPNIRDCEGKDYGGADNVVGRCN